MIALLLFYLYFAHSYPLIPFGHQDIDQYGWILMTDSYNQVANTWVATPFRIPNGFSATFT